MIKQQPRNNKELFWSQFVGIIYDLKITLTIFFMSIKENGCSMSSYSIR